MVNERHVRMKGLCRIFVCLLTVCVLLANVASFSPSFHVWWDHGYTSATLTHRHDDWGGVASQGRHSHRQNLMPAHVPIRISLQELMEAQPVVPQDAPEPDHRHNTLSQFLLSGTIESAMLLFAPVFESARRIWLKAVCSVRMPEVSWHVQTAPRGPPVSISFA